MGIVWEGWLLCNGGGGRCSEFGFLGRCLGGGLVKGRRVLDIEGGLVLRRR